MSRSYNFGAGPAVLPNEVLARIWDDIPDSHRGMSVMEVSHRSKEFINVAERAGQDLRDLLAIGPSVTHRRTPPAVFATPAPSTGAYS